MFSIDNIKISTRLVIGFGMMAVLLLLSSATSLFKANNLHHDFETVIQKQYPKVVQIEEIRHLFSQNELAISNMLHYKERASHDDMIEKIKTKRQEIDKKIQFFEQQSMEGEEKKVFEEFKALRIKYLEIQDKYIELILEDRAYDALFTLILEMPYAREDYHKALEKIVAIQNDLMNQSVDIAKDSVQNMYLVIGGSTLIALIGATILSLWIIRTITRPIAQAVGIAHAVAQGRLTQPIDVKGNNETAQLLQSLKQMQSSLVQVVTQVREGSEGIAAASSEIAQSNQDLSERTENQASALHETSAAMDQLNTRVQQNADHALEANHLAKKASDIASEGGNAMQSVERTMQAIDSSAQRIADIIGVIDGIAFQTNILALNAAVEAARAGEQGRGFAVVATEVRALAGRSAEAAREIKRLIDTSQNSVNAGVQEVQHTGQIMSEVVQSIAQVAKIMGEITGASREQSQGVQQVNHAVIDMEQSTQQNATLVEEMAAAAMRLSQQSRVLVQTVSVFEISNTGKSINTVEEGDNSHAFILGNHHHSNNLSLA